MTKTRWWLLVSLILNLSQSGSIIVRLLSISTRDMYNICQVQQIVSFPSFFLRHWCFLGIAVRVLFSKHEALDVLVLGEGLRPCCFVLNYKLLCLIEHRILVSPAQQTVDQRKVNILCGSKLGFYKIT